MVSSTVFLACIENSERKSILVLGPFDLSRKDRLLLELRAFSSIKYDFYVTGENKPPRFDVAKKKLGSGEATGVGRMF